MIGPNYPVSLKIVKLDYKLLFNCPPPRVKSVAIWVASIIKIGSRAIFRHVINIFIIMIFLFLAVSLLLLNQLFQVIIVN